MTDRTVANIAAKTGRSEDDARAYLAGTNPMGRLVRPDEVAAAVLWLVSEPAGMVTGQAITLSGGEP
jgi:3-hydroxybutyrate dehydrogenase